MGRLGQGSAQLLAGLLFVAGYATPQRYTLSAKSGAVNAVEGTAYLNGNRLSEQATRATFLSANDTLATEAGKAEVLLSPGVFLRLGDNTEIRMISPSLVNSQLEVMRGEAMVEVAGLVKDNTVQVTDHGASVTIERDGLYRITADGSPAVAVLDGKALVNFGSHELNLTKGHEAVLGEMLKPEKFDTKQPDDLYAWSNVRSEYDSAASYQTASNVGANSFGGWGGYGFGGWSTPGWYWASGFNSWAWLPGAGAFYSPFGYGFYAPGAVGYAPVVYAPVYSGISPNRNRLQGAVPVNPRNPAAVGARTTSPAANQLARAAAAQSFASSGFRTASGAPVAAFSGSHMSAVSRGGNVGVASGGGSGRGVSAMSSAGGGGMSAGAARGGGAGVGGGHR